MELWGRFCVWHPKCKHYVLNSPPPCIYHVYRTLWHPLCSLKMPPQGLRCHRRGSMVSQCLVPCGHLVSLWPQVWRLSLSSWRQPHSPPSPGLCLSSPPYPIETKTQPRGQWWSFCSACRKVKREGRCVFSESVDSLMDGAVTARTQEPSKALFLGSRLLWEPYLASKWLTGEHLLSIRWPPPHTGIVMIFLKKS